MLASVVVPTYNEAKNIRGIVESIISSADVEVIVIDDGSPDGTGKIADELASAYGIRVIHRSGKLGLASAILDGFKAASSDIVGVIDADFSHPTSLIPKLIEPIRAGQAEIAVGSRYVPGGGEENWPMWRRITSAGAVLLASPLTNVKDPVSGFFFLRKSVIEGVKLDTIGFKLGLEILVKGKYGRVIEVPYVFHDRSGGKSKFNYGEYVNYVRHLVMLYAHKLGLR